MVRELIPDRSGTAVTVFLKGTKHRFYEDRFRLLSRDVPIVRKSNRGEIFAVFDGIGSAPMGRQAAQLMADILIEFYKKPETYEASMDGLLKLLKKGNLKIHSWGTRDGTDIPLGGCAGTIAWLFEGTLHVFHVGDTAGVLITDTNRYLLTREHQIETGEIYRYFGLGPDLEIDTMALKVDEFDRILLVSDGVTKALMLEEAIEMVRNYEDPASAARTLVFQARAFGSEDDITAIVIEVEEEEM